MNTTANVISPSKELALVPDRQRARRVAKLRTYLFSSAKCPKQRSIIGDVFIKI